LHFGFTKYIFTIKKWSPATTPPEAEKNGAKPKSHTIRILKYNKMKKTLLLSLLTLLFCGLLSNSTYAQFNKMLIGDNNNGQIVIANIDGSEIDTVNLGGLYQSFYDADIDPIHEKIYMAWYYGIYSMNYDGSNFDTLVAYSGGDYSSGIAVDPVNGYIYWGSSPESTLYRADLDGNNKTTILTGVDYIADVDIDLANGYLFYGRWIFAGSGLYRVDLNGTNNVTIVSGYEVSYLGLDLKNDVIYFSDGSACRRINYNGTNDTLLFSFQPGGFFVDTTNSLVYYSRMSNNKIFKSDLSGGNVVDLITTQLEAPFGPVLFNSCFSIIAQPAIQNKIEGEDAMFSVKTSIANNSFQWQTDTGSGFYNIIDGTQYNGANNDTLEVLNTTLANNAQLFRCILNSHTCTDTSEVAILTVYSTAGVKEVNEQKLFSIYPNPAYSIINVSVNKQLIGTTYYITDQLGRKIMTGILNKENSTIELDNLSEGIYMFSIGTFTKQTFTLIKK
jgi:hypothetical protein